MLEMVEILAKKDIETYQQELTTGDYMLPEIHPFLARCSNRYTYVMEQVRIEVLCYKTLGKALRGQIIRSLCRANAVLRMFSLDKPLTVVLVPVPRPRMKPEGIVEPKHVNGGYTYVNKNTIYIYRLEEWPKVMLHEVLHHVPALQNTRWTTVQLQKLYDAFQIDTWGCPGNCRTVLEPTEAIIEAWAIFLHTVFMSIETGKDIQPLLQDETQWCDHQIRWILKKKGAMEWRETTHLFSYIVLRGILLHHLERFLAMQIPYSSADLIHLWIQEWADVSTRHTKGTIPKKGTLRMSRYGDM